MPDWTEELRQRLAPLRLSPSRESEIIEELSQHLDLRYEELLDSGMPDVEARRVALEELRGPEVLAQHMRTLRQAVRMFSDREAWRGLMLNGMAADHSWETSAREYVKVYRRARQDAAARAGH